jgi:hypothetical protein
MIQGGNEKCWWQLARSLWLEPASSRTSMFCLRTRMYLPSPD